MGKSAFCRRTAFRDPRRTIFVALDCSKPEALYFRALRVIDGITLQVIPTDPALGAASNAQVLGRLERWLKKNRPHSRDELWIVIDREQTAIRELDAVCAGAAKQGINVAMSNPCFELWLWLHVRDNQSFPTPGECRAAFAREYPQWGARPDAATLIANGVEAALIRAGELDINPGAPWPSTQATRVSRLVARLLACSCG